MSQPDYANAAVRPAATLVLLRDTADGLELLMQRRSPEAAFLGGAYVFPGGALQAPDGEPGVRQRIVGLTEAQACEELGLHADALAYWVAAVRECFEEAGILLAHDATGADVSPARVALDMAADRRAIDRGWVTLADVLVRRELFIRVGDIVYFDHWITPPMHPRRFDTRFFVARAPKGQDGTHDDHEAVHSAWLRPAEALELAGRGQIRIASATTSVLTEFSRFGSVAQALAHARAKRPVQVNMSARAALS